MSDGKKKKKKKKQPWKDTRGERPYIYAAPPKVLREMFGPMTAAVYEVIDDLSGGPDCACWAGFTKIARLIGVKDRHAIGRHVQLLIAAGVVHEIPRKRERGTRWYVSDREAVKALEDRYWENNGAAPGLIEAGQAWVDKVKAAAAEEKSRRSKLHLRTKGRSRRTNLRRRSGGNYTDGAVEITPQSSSSVSSSIESSSRKKSSKKPRRKSNHTKRWRAICQSQGLQGKFDGLLERVDGRAADVLSEASAILDNGGFGEDPKTPAHQILRRLEVAAKDV